MGRGLLRGLAAEDYVGTYQQIKGVTVTRGFYKAKEPRIWPDNEYPYRFDFRKGREQGREIPGKTRQKDP